MQTVAQPPKQHSQLKDKTEQNRRWVLFSAKDKKYIYYAVYKIGHCWIHKFEYLQGKKEKLFYAFGDWFLFWSVYIWV